MVAQLHLLEFLLICFDLLCESGMLFDEVTVNWLRFLIAVAEPVHLPITLSQLLHIRIDVVDELLIAFFRVISGSLKVSCYYLTPLVFLGCAGLPLIEKLGATAAIPPPVAGAPSGGVERRLKVRGSIEVLLTILLNYWVPV